MGYRTTPILLPTILLCSLFATISPIDAQQASSAQSTISSALNGMKATTWKQREAAFGKAAQLLGNEEVSANDKEQVRLSIIQLLVHENSGGLKEPEQPQQNYGEGYGEDKAEYYVSLIEFVADLNDERAIPALLGATGSGGIAIRAVVGFGKKALNPTLDQVRNSDPYLASDALLVVREMLITHSVDDADSNLQIKNALRAALRSPEYHVRENAIDPIEYLVDRKEFIPLLQDIAHHDLYNVPRADGTGRVYVVRARAQLLLRKIIN
jgi:hypothetical protein